MSQIYWPDLKNECPFETRSGVSSTYIVLVCRANSEPIHLFERILASSYIIHVLNWSCSPNLPLFHFSWDLRIFQNDFSYIIHVLNWS